MGLAVLSCNPYAHLKKEAIVKIRDDYKARFQSIQTISRFIQLNNTDTLCDIASGAGHSISILANYLPANTTYLVEDISSIFCNKTNFKHFFNLVESKANIENFQFFRGTSTKIPFATNSLKHASVFISIHEFAYKEKMMQELYRILSPSGKLYILETVSKNGVTYKDDACGFTYLQHNQFSNLISNTNFTVLKDTSLLEPTASDSTYARFLVLSK